MRIIYVKKDAFPDDMIDGQDNGSGIIFTRSFYTAKDIISDGLPTIVLADNARFTEDSVGAHASAFFATVKHDTAVHTTPPNIICLIVSDGESVLLSDDVNGIVAARGKFSMAGYLIRMARTFTNFVRT